ncbi:hypothetical protein EP47_09600 [Legionella norrlandica]|uniref:Uncharacterized protein n=1 Tax=Legionella norrlandica TaxID=1498499 RepID=A0A0A2T7S8_9GAMM|nr:hypothetical protein [Legionella norrlandica]KGP63453.1 hypothetical protein EP47_09600 [Legionella norrlandica]
MIIYLNGHLSLWQKNKDGAFSESDDQKTPALGDSYNLIKSISHCSVWLTMIFQSMIERRARNSRHIIDLLKLKSCLHDLRCLDEKIRPELPVIHKIMTYLAQAQVITNLSQMKKLQSQYLQEMKIINEDYASRAAQLQLQGMHKILGGWKTNAGIQLEKTRVLIVCSHGPREELIEKQYFLDLYAKYGIPDAEKRSSHIICVEMLPEQIATVGKDSLIDFLRKHQINSLIGQDMLGDSQAMNKDVLGKYAPDVLRSFCPYHVKSSVSGRNSIFTTACNQRKETELSKASSEDYNCTIK